MAFKGKNGMDLFLLLLMVGKMYSIEKIRIDGEFWFPCLNLEGA